MNNYKKGLLTLACCQEEPETTCGVILFKLTEGQEEGRTQLFLVIGILAMFVLLVYYFLKPLPANIDDFDPSFFSSQNYAYRSEV